MMNNAQENDPATQSLSISTIPVCDSQNPTMITTFSSKSILGKHTLSSYDQTEKEAKPDQKYKKAADKLVNMTLTRRPLHSPEIKIPPTTSETTRLWIASGDSDLRVVIWDGVFLGFLMNKPTHAYFRVKKHLGSGDHASVNHVVCLKANLLFRLKKSSEVAIKKLKNPTYLENCDTEKYCETVSILSYLQTISHENITKYYGTYFKSCKDSNCFQRHLIFEYVPGINLSKIILYLKEHTLHNLTLEHTNYLFKQVSAVIHCLEYHSISHKDLHSNNLIYSFKTNQLKIIDFGYSTQIEKDSSELKIANLFDMQHCLYELSHCFLKNKIYSESEESMTEEQKTPATIAGYHTNLKLSWENLDILDEKIKEMLALSAQITNQLGPFYYYHYDLEELNSLNLDPSSFLEKFHNTMRSLKNSEPLPPMK